MITIDFCQQEFTGNTDQTTKVEQTFHEPVVALHIAIVPTTWETSVMDLPALRFELMGCQVKYFVISLSFFLTA